MNKILIHLNQVYEGLTLLDQSAVEKIVDELRRVKRDGGTVYLCGNGGSHSTASHFAQDLSKMCKLKTVCLGDAVPVMLAYGNDEGWENMYASALTGRLQSDDVVIGISCSGNSDNVVNALWEAKLLGVQTIGMTGPDQNSKRCTRGADVLVHAVAEDIRVQEDIHLIICHAVVRAMQDA